MTNHHPNRKQEPKFRVTLITDGGKIATQIVGSFASAGQAHAAAKRAAGKGARYVSEGVSFGYSGANGYAAITE